MITPRKLRLLLPLALGAALLGIGLASQGERFRVYRLRRALTHHQALDALTITYPFDGAVFPPEIVAPHFRWSDLQSSSQEWLVSVRFEGAQESIESLVRTPTWRPSPQQWDEMKRRSAGSKAVVSVIGRGTREGQEAYLQGTVTFTTSKDTLQDQIFYREVILPFSEAVKDPSRIRWRFGSLAHDSQPPVVLERLPVCGNCHSFSADGKVLGMDVDYGNDKGSYAATAVAKEMSLATSDIFTWSDYKRDPENPTFGLLSQVSPNGRFVVSTVKDRSVFVPTPNLAFSQLFFPIQGILAVYDRTTQSFSALPGADDRELVQSNPVWSPDGRTIVFARSQAYQLKNLRDKQKALLSPEECQEFVDGHKPFKFDLYRIPFNGGQGGKAEPLVGASGNGLSNYFPRFSPDGRWIVFCQAANFMLLQPDSRLFIMPATGGEARPLRANTARMNSWHSWSSNGRWLVFSSKANTPYTQLFVTHIDEQGADAPPVLLEQLTSPDRAANIPEFVAVPPDTIQRISPRFVDDVSLWRSGMAFMDAGDFQNARDRFKEALALNPRNLKARIVLGNTLEASGHDEEALVHYKEATQLDPASAIAHINVGNMLLKKKDLPGAIAEYELALKHEPDNIYAHYNLGQCYAATDKNPEALVHLATAHRQSPTNAAICFLLGNVHAKLGHRGEAISFYKEAIHLRPDFAEAREKLTALEPGRE